MKYYAYARVKFPVTDTHVYISPVMLLFLRETGIHHLRLSNLTTAPAESVKSTIKKYILESFSKCTGISNIMKVGWKSVPGGWTGVEESTFTKSCSCSCIQRNKVPFFHGNRKISRNGRRAFYYVLSHNRCSPNCHLVSMFHAMNG